MVWRQNSIKICVTPYTQTETFDDDIFVAAEDDVLPVELIDYLKEINLTS